MKKEEIIKVEADLSIEAYCHCPYCDSFEDVYDEVKESLDNDGTGRDLGVEVKCSECEEIFIVDKVVY